MEDKKFCRIKIFYEWCRKPLRRQTRLIFLIILRNFPKIFLSARSSEMFILNFLARVAKFLQNFMKISFYSPNFLKTYFTTFLTSSERNKRCLAWERQSVPSLYFLIVLRRSSPSPDVSRTIIGLRRTEIRHTGQLIDNIIASIATRFLVPF